MKRLKLVPLANFLKKKCFVFGNPLNYVKYMFCLLFDFIWFQVRNYSKQTNQCVANVVASRSIRSHYIGTMA